jgi:ketosteroid isomerase-like protein
MKTFMVCVMVVLLTHGVCWASGSSRRAQAEEPEAATPVDEKVAAEIKKVEAQIADLQKKLEGLKKPATAAPTATTAPVAATAPTAPPKTVAKAAPEAAGDETTKAVRATVEQWLRGRTEGNLEAVMAQVADDAPARLELRRNAADEMSMQGHEYRISDFSVIRDGDTFANANVVYDVKFDRRFARFHVNFRLGKTEGGAWKIRLLQATKPSYWVD